MTALEIARLEVLSPLVAKGRLGAGSAEAAEYARLKGIEAEEAAAAGAVVLPVEGLTTKKEQAAFYQVSERTVGYWKEKGAPLHRPRDMMSWWAKAFPGKPVNRGILATLGKGPAVAVPVAAPVAAPVAPRPALVLEQQVADPVVVPAGVEIGFDATHQRMLAEEAALYSRIKRMEERGDFEGADGLRPSWVRLSESLGAADTRQIKNALQRGDLLVRAQVEQEYARLLRAHPEVLRHELKAVREEMEPVPPAAVWDARVDQVLDSLFRAMPNKLMEAA